MDKCIENPVGLIVHVSRSGQKRSEARQLHQPAYKLSCGASRITKNNNSKKL